MLVPWCLKRHFLAPGEAPPPGGVVDEDRGLVVLQRFCHVHGKGELESMLREAVEGLGGEFVVAPTAHQEQLPLPQSTPPAAAAAPPVAVVKAAGGGGGGGGKKPPARERASPSDPVTSKLMALGKGMKGFNSNNNESGGGGHHTRPVYTLCLSWWEADNWCVLVEKD